MLNVRIYPKRITPTEFEYQLQIHRDENMTRIYEPIFKTRGTDINTGLDILGICKEEAPIFGLNTFGIYLTPMRPDLLRRKYTVLVNGTLKFDENGHIYQEGLLVNRF